MKNYLSLQKNKLDEITLQQYQRLIKNKNLTIEKNNPIKGEILPPKPSALKKEVLFLTQEPDLEKFKSLGKGIPVAFGFSAGGLSSRGGGLFTADFIFKGKKIPPLLQGHSFTSIKLAQAKKFQDHYRTVTGNKKFHLPILIMTSPIRLEAVAQALSLDFDALSNALGARGYVSYYDTANDLTLFLFLQGLQKRIVPQEFVLKKYREQFIRNKKKLLSPSNLKSAVAALNKGILSERNRAGEILLTPQGTPVLNPPGHWDFIRHLALSGLLNHLKSCGIKYLFHSNLNNPAAHIDTVLLGAFQSQIDKGRKPVALFLLGENREEKGGLLATVRAQSKKPMLQLVEATALTPKASKLIERSIKENRLFQTFPYFNTASFILNVGQLLKLFGDNVDRVSEQLPVYMDLKEEVTASQGEKRILVGYQLERIYGDITALTEWIPVVIDRNIHFIPIKETADLKDSKKLNQLSQTLKECALLKPHHWKQLKG